MSTNENTPISGQFWDWMQSYWHKNRDFPPAHPDWRKKADLVNGKVPAGQLPSYVDDVLEFDSYTSLPQTGEKGKIYITTKDNKQFRWGGSAYIEINSGEKVGSKIINGSYNANDLSTNSITYGYSVANAPSTVGAHSFSILNLDTANPDYKMQLGFDGDTNEMFSRIKSNGNWNNWSKYVTLSQLENVVTTNTDQGIYGYKEFYTSGGANSYSSTRLKVSGFTGNNAIIGFNSFGAGVGTMQFNGDQFFFTKDDIGSYAGIKSGGFVKNGSDDNYVLLGGGHHKLLSELGTTHNHQFLYSLDTLNIDANTLLEDYKLKFNQRIHTGSTNMFPMVNNANSIISLASHPQGYGNQLGFNGDEQVFFRAISAGNYGNWKQFAFRDWVNSTFLTQANADIAIAQINNDIAGKVNKSGDIMSGGLKINIPNGTSFGSAPHFELNSSNLDNTRFLFHIPESNRAKIYVGNSGNWGIIDLQPSGGDATLRGESIATQRWVDTKLTNKVSQSGANYYIGWDGFENYFFRDDVLQGYLFHSGNLNPVTIDTNQTITHQKTFNSGIAVTSGQKINLAGYGDPAHYIKRFDDDTDGFGISTGFAVKPYNDSSKNLLLVDGSGTYVNGNRVWDLGNFNPERKAERENNAVGIGFEGGNIENPYMKHNAGAAYLATKNWITGSFIPKTHPASSIGQSQINGWNNSISQSSASQEVILEDDTLKIQPDEFSLEGSGSYDIASRKKLVHVLLREGKEVNIRELVRRQTIVVFNFSKDPLSLNIEGLKPYPLSPEMQVTLYVSDEGEVLLYNETAFKKLQ